MAARSVLDDNKRLVTEFYELAINQQKPAEAARKYIDLPYRQHPMALFSSLARCKRSIRS